MNRPTALGLDLNRLVLRRTRALFARATLLALFDRHPNLALLDRFLLKERRGFIAAPFHLHGRVRSFNGMIRMRCVRLRTVLRISVVAAGRSLIARRLATQLWRPLLSDGNRLHRRRRSRRGARLCRRSRQRFRRHPPVCIGSRLK